MGSQVICPKLSYRVMQAVFEAHNTLGPGFAECLYEEALAIELERSQISFERQACVEVSYKGTLIGTHRLDLFGGSEDHPGAEGGVEAHRCLQEADAILSQGCKSEAGHPHQLRHAACQLL